MWENLVDDFGIFCHPYGAKTVDNVWIAGGTHIDFLTLYYGDCDSLEAALQKAEKNNHESLALAIKWKLTQ